MCEKGQRLRVLVNERLTAAAQEIFALFERTIAEYEEELCRSKEENKRKQQLLDSVLSPQVLLPKPGVQIHFVSREEEAGPSLNEENTQSAWIKAEPEEQSVRQREEQVPEFTAVSVKSEDQPSLLQQRQAEQDRGETEGEDYILDPFQQFYSDNESVEDNEDWEPSAGSSARQMEAEAEGDDYNRVQSEKSTAAGKSIPFFKFKISSTDNSSPQSSVTVINNDLSDTGGKTKPHECPVCQKRFMFKHELKIHMRVHTGEKPYSCSVCNKSFTQSCNLRTHERTHSGVKPYSCSVCSKRFLLKAHLNTHMRTHTGEKPFSCKVCHRAFMHKVSLNIHMEKSHWG